MLHGAVELLHSCLVLAQRILAVRVQQSPPVDHELYNSMMLRMVRI